MSFLHGVKNKNAGGPSRESTVQDSFIYSHKLRGYF